MSGGKELNVPAGRMAIPLMKHQRLALAWMLHRERTAANPRGGILADDQGLGKTVSTIALIVTNQPGDDVADVGFEELDSDTDDADADTDADAAANADAAATANTGAAAAIAQSGAICSAAQSAPASATNAANGSMLPHESHKALNLKPSLPHTSCTDKPLSVSTDDQQSVYLDGRQHAQASAQTMSPANGATHNSVNDLQNRSGDKSQAVKAGQGSSRQHSALGDGQGSGNTAGLPEGGTLIVCPTAVLNQWARELEAKVAPPAGTHSASLTPICSGSLYLHALWYTHAGIRFVKALDKLSVN